MNGYSCERPFLDFLSTSIKGKEGKRETPCSVNQKILRPFFGRF
jgi:hypothetical protein